eukprot:gb/GFBE01012103.1/.p1 GENE.gb/GFBE01012103.1/~~gb/GFBE01012103.1/.p1  ORF type:complete len:201 (+),score=36.70 gb/GFBE01012103.1/:1-603(+)
MVAAAVFFTVAGGAAAVLSVWRAWRVLKGTGLQAGPYLREGQASYVGWRDDRVLQAWVKTHLPAAEAKLGAEALRLAVAKKDARDGVLPDGSSEYHITLCGSFEKTTAGDQFSDLQRFLRDAESRLSLQRVQPLGMGLLQEADGNFAAMVVVRWPELQELRENYSLRPNYPHITVGFRDSDIHSMPKDHTCLIRESDEQY